jgi:hypothetical protein
MSNVSENKQEYQLLENSKGSKSKFRKVKNDKGENCLEYSINFEIPDGLNDKEINFLKVFMVKSLYTADYWLNKTQTPKEYLNIRYNTVFWIWIDVAAKLSVFYFYGYLRNTKKFGLPVRFLGTFGYLYGTSMAINFLNSLFNFNINNTFNQYLLGVRDSSILREYDSFEEKLLKTISENYSKDKENNKLNQI